VTEKVNLKAVAKDDLSNVKIDANKIQK